MLQIKAAKAPFFFLVRWESLWPSLDHFADITFSSASEHSECACHMIHSPCFLREGSPNSHGSGCGLCSLGWIVDHKVIPEEKGALREAQRTTINLTRKRAKRMELKTSN